MKKVRPEIRLIILLFLAGFWGCENAPVDKEYTRSSEFKSFQEKQKREYAAQVESRKSLKKYLSAYHSCEKGQKWELPLQIDYNTLGKFGTECEQIGSRFNTDFVTKNIGYTSYGNIMIRWLLLKKETAYENWEFLAVTYLDDTLRNFQSLGSYRKNLLQDISTAISVSSKEDELYISTTMDRGFTYPFKYKTVVERTYRVDSLGTISLQTKSLKNY